MGGLLNIRPRSISVRHFCDEFGNRNVVAKSIMKYLVWFNNICHQMFNVSLKSDSCDRQWTEGFRAIDNNRGFRK